jgi:adenosylcobyric acid synthase
MTAKTLMVQGTMSSAGKSLLVTGLCRLYTKRGVKVAPYKSQNMSNNAAVCPDGAEIGRAQYTQALACGVIPTAEMNPILLKPEADSRSQVVVLGKALDTLSAHEYYQKKTVMWQTAIQALDHLRHEYDLVIIEGAGSPVEINLLTDDIVNMPIARYAQSPVLLASDIDRGGIFAQLLGTLWLLEPEDRQLIKGLLVNKFRGDLSLFQDGIRMLEEKSSVPVLGVIPYIHHRIPEEDAVAIEAQNFSYPATATIDIIVVRLPRIANFDEFDALESEPGVRLRYIDTPQEFGIPDAVIIPGTKSTIADLEWLKSHGLYQAIIDYAKNDGNVVGICGGYQMLGSTISDPNHTESLTISQEEGLGLLPIETVFTGEKSTYQAIAEIMGKNAWLEHAGNEDLTGYEIHMGSTTHNSGEPWLRIILRGNECVSIADGAISPDGKIWGCYIHGIFNNTRFRHTWLESLGWKAINNEPSISLDQAMNQLADELEKAIDIKRLDHIIGL